LPGGDLEPDACEDDTPYTDVQPVADGFSIPVLKWRELLFVGAVRAEGDGYVRDPACRLPPFRLPDLFPAGVRFRVAQAGGRVIVRREPDG
jgi:hypothetical protein